MLSIVTLSHVFITMSLFMIFWKTVVTLYSEQFPLSKNHISSFFWVEREKSKSGKRDSGAFTIEEVCDIQNFSQELGARLKLHNLRGTFKFVLRSTNKFSAWIFRLINATSLQKFIINPCFGLLLLPFDKELTLFEFLSSIPCKGCLNPNGTKWRLIGDTNALSSFHPITAMPEK